MLMWVEYDSLTISEPQCLPGLRLCLKDIVDHTNLTEHEYVLLLLYNINPTLTLMLNKLLQYIRINTEYIFFVRDRV